MPELPEVETIRRGLEEYLVGHTIQDIEVRMPKIVEGETQSILGAKVDGVRRFGKGLVIDLDNEHSIAVHIKLTGQLIYQNQELRIKNKGKVKIIRGTYGDLPHKATHVIFTLDQNAVLYYNDFRRFGWIKIVESAKLQDVSFFKDLGPELPVLKYTSNEERSSHDVRTVMTEELFMKLLKSARTPIKPLLLDQKKIAGLGNIYVNDGLWDAEIDPRRSAKQITEEEAKTLYKSLIKVLKKGLEVGGASELSYVNALGQEGGYQKHFLVYSQEGKPCKRDGNPIEKIKLGGRGTYFCPTCQK